MAAAQLHTDTVIYSVSDCDDCSGSLEIRYACWDLAGSTCICVVGMCNTNHYVQIQTPTACSTGNHHLGRVHEVGQSPDKFIAIDNVSSTPGLARPLLGKGGAGCASSMGSTHARASLALDAFAVHTYMKNGGKMHKF